MNIQAYVNGNCSKTTEYSPDRLAKRACGKSLPGVAGGISVLAGDSSARQAQPDRGKVGVCFAATCTIRLNRSIDRGISMGDLSQQDQRLSQLVVTGGGKHAWYLGRSAGVLDSLCLDPL